MELGQWQIVKTAVETEQIDDISEYTIHVTAAPYLNGCSTLYGQNTGNLQDAYAATYFMTYAEFVFSANGEIIYFNMDSPLDVIGVHNENVATLPITELLEKCKQQLSFSDADAYGLPSDIQDEIEAATGEKLLCQVSISNFEYGLGRVKVPDSDDNYYYIPVMALRGIAEYTTEQTGAIYYSNSPIQSDDLYPILVCVNAVDGSIIQQ